MTKARVVAFDIDGTLLQGQSGTLILKYLMTRRLVRIRTIALCSWWGIRYKLHLPYRQNEPRERIFTDLSQYTPEGIHRMMEMFHDDIMVLNEYFGGTITSDNMKMLSHEMKKGLKGILSQKGISKTRFANIIRDGYYADRFMIPEPEITDRKGLQIVNI